MKQIKMTEIRKEIQGLLNMTDQPEKQFEMALSLGERPKNPPFTKKEWKIICEICGVSGLEKILF